jgi:hypothetical protein
LAIITDGQTSDHEGSDTADVAGAALQTAPMCTWHLRTGRRLCTYLEVGGAQSNGEGGEVELQVDMSRCGVTKGNMMGYAGCWCLLLYLYHRETGVHIINNTSE